MAAVAAVAVGVDGAGAVSAVSADAAAAAANAVADGLVVVVDVQPRARYCWSNWESGHFEFDGDGLGC